MYVAFVTPRLPLTSWTATEPVKESSMDGMPNRDSVEEIAIVVLDPTHVDRVNLVASRMRRTLVEVLGLERGEAMCSLDWLRARVLWHLDPTNCVGQVFLAVCSEVVLGHTIVRIENDAGAHPHGLFSTIYVDPEQRRRGVGSRLLFAGERWFRGNGVEKFATKTAKANAKLVELFGRHGYNVVGIDEENQMVRLEYSGGERSP